MSSPSDTAAAALPPDPGQKPLLILYYHTMWGGTISARGLSAGFQLTTARRQYRAADAVVFHVPELKWTPRFLLPRKRPRQMWVAWSMECEENYPRLKDPAFMQQFDLTMLYRRDSNIPALYSNVYGTPEEIQRLLRRPAMSATERAPAVMLISSRIDRSGRQAYARDLMRRLQVDSYGKFLRNRHLEDDRGGISKQQTIARYKFTLAFENAVGHDYVTEKFFDPLICGSVPVYLGAPNIEDFAPGDHCYINVQDFPGPAVLADYLNHLAHDDVAFGAYFEWKERPLRAEFCQLLERNRTPALTRLCHAIRQRRALPC